jgi:hypothetical protein
MYFLLSMGKIYKTLIIFFIVFIFEIKSSEAEIKESVNSLKNNLKDKIDPSLIDLKKKNNYTYKKTNLLTFSEAAAVYCLLEEKEYGSRLAISALQRMYYICSDIFISEHILWNLGLTYEKRDENALAYEIFGMFKKLFPGSTCYKISKYKEIKNGLKLTKNHNYDEEKILALIIICDEFLDEFKETKDSLWIDVLFVLEAVSLRLIRKYLSIAEFYINRFNYINNNTNIFSSIKRLVTANNFIKDIIEQNRWNDIINSDHKNFIFSIEKTSNEIESFIKKYSIEMPCGKLFIDNYNLFISKIEINKKTINADLKKTLKHSFESIKKTNKYIKY